MTAALAKPNVAAKLVGWDDSAQDYRDVAVDANGQIATTTTVAADIEIGAIEIKNDSDDTRAKVGSGARANALRVTIATDDTQVTAAGAVGDSAVTDPTASASMIAALKGLLTTTKKPSTATLANVSGSASSVTLIAANASRLGAVIVNESTAVCYVKFGSTASATSYTYALSGASAAPFATLEVPAGYTGIITGIWTSATGTARTTELT